MTSLATAVVERSRREREDWRYTDIEKLLKNLQKPEAFHASTQRMPTYEESVQGCRFVFVDGKWSKDESSFGLFPPAFLKGDASHGYQLACAEGSCLVTAPIELVFRNEKASEASVNLMVEFGASASGSIIEHHVSGAAEPSTGLVQFNMRLGAQAKLVHKKIIHDLGGHAHFARTSVRVGDGAFFKQFVLIKNARLSRHEVDVSLDGKLAQCALNGALLLRGHEHVDVQTRVNHMAEDGISRQLFKAVLKDQSRGVFQGRIHVAKGAQKTDGKQLCRALLLSDQAEMDAKPELEIYADDVKCSHGCAVGDLDKDAMFYLRTRGLSENDARSLLLGAFVDEVIDEIQLDQARAYVRGLAGAWMNE